MDDRVTNDKREPHERYENAQAAFAETEEDQNAGGKHQVELLFNCERPAPSEVLLSDRQEIVDVQNISPEVFGVQSFGHSRYLVEEVEAQQHDGCVDRNQAQKAAHVEAREDDAAGFLELAEEDGANEESADDEEQVDAEQAIYEPASDGINEHEGGLCGKDPQAEEEHVEHHHPEDGNGTHAIDYGLLEPGTARKILPVVTDVEIRHKTDRGRSIGFQMDASGERDAGRGSAKVLHGGRAFCRGKSTWNARTGVSRRSSIHLG